MLGLMLITPLYCDQVQWKATLKDGPRWHFTAESSLDRSERFMSNNSKYIQDTQTSQYADTFIHKLTSCNTCNSDSTVSQILWF